VTVSASSSEVLSEVKLYIDGEEQWMSNDGTNFLISTCEWPNGSHTIFATAKSQSVMEGVPHNDTITYGRSVSAYINVTFDNLITRFDFSEPFFEPSLGQTQFVSAIFAANVDWTLEIQNANNQDVLYVTGSGATMQYAWDGTGTNGVALPDGVYGYLLTVSTNGQAMPSPDGGDGGPDGPPGLRGATVATDEGDSTALPTSIDQAIALGLDYYFIVLPMPRLNINGVWYSWEDVFGPVAPIQVPVPRGVIARLLSIANGTATDVSLNAGNTASLMDAGTPSSQSAKGPKKKPAVGVKNQSGTFGICYKTYGPAGFVAQEPPSGLVFPLQTHVAIDGFSAGSSLLHWGTLLSTKNEAMGFSKGMKIGGYKPKFIKADEQWGPLDIQKAALGGSSVFNTCNFGLLMSHGAYATSSEVDGVKYTYFPLWDAKHGSSYVRLSDLDLGSTGVNGLRWMTFLTCNTFKAANVTSMANNSRLPDNDNLHLMLGANSYLYADNWLGFYYASNMVGAGKSIWQSFQDAGTAAYGEDYNQPQNKPSMTNSVVFRVIGVNACLPDTLYLYSDPEFFTQIIDVTVFTP